MLEPPSDPRRAYQFISHYRLANDYYNERQLGSAIKHYRLAVDHGQAVGTNDLMQAVLHCKASIGMCYFQQGYYRQAFAELAQFLDLGAQEVELHMRYSALVHYIQAAQRIPVKLAAIRKAYDEARNILNSNGALSWRHEILVHLGRLEFSRGEYQVALEAAKEALVLKATPNEGGYAGQVWDFHFDGLVDICLGLGFVNEAERYTNEWEARPDQMPTNRHVRRSRCRADIARARGDSHAAMNWSSVSLEAALQTDYLEVRSAALRSFIQARLLTKELKLVRDALVVYAHVRLSESAIECFGFYISLSEYYICHIEAGSPGYDVKARRSLNRAQKIASEIDRKLQTERYKQIVRDRRERLQR